MVQEKQLIVINKIILRYDEVYSYKEKSLNFNKINKILNNLNNNKIILDAYNNELIYYLQNSYTINTIKCKFIYTELDDNYEIIAIKEPRCFNQDTYDNYINSMKNTILAIKNNIKKLLEKKIIDKVIYLYRKNNNYIEYNDDSHLLNILNKKKEYRLLRYIDNISGAKNYQSIILNNEYIRKGTEKDWITFENILKCTSLKNKVIMDTCCFNGYFSFKALENGAKKVIGIDQNKPALKICNKLCIYNNYHIWINGKKLIILVN